MIRRTSGASRFNIYKVSKVLGLTNMKEVISKRDDLIMDALFHSEPVHRFEYRGDMFKFFGFQLLHEQRSFAVTGDDILVFCGKLRYIELQESNLARTREVAIRDAVLMSRVEVTDMAVAPDKD